MRGYWGRDGACHSVRSEVYFVDESCMTLEEYRRDRVYLVGAGCWGDPCSFSASINGAGSSWSPGKIL